MNRGSQESLNSQEKQPLLQQSSPERTAVTEPLVCFSIKYYYTAVTVSWSPINH